MLLTRELVDEDPFCDEYENCLPNEFAVAFSMISYIWSIFSVVLETIEGLRLDDKLESFAYILPNFMVRCLIIILILSFLNITWILPFLMTVLTINSLYLLKAGSFCQSLLCPEVFRGAVAKLSSYCYMPPNKNRVSSLLTSLPLPLLVSEDITLKEIGVIESEEDRKQSERSLSLFSISNMMVFLPVSVIPVYMLVTGLLKFNKNVIISLDQLQQIFLHIVLPLAGLALLASLLVLLSFCNNILKKILLFLVTAGSVILPVAVGTMIVEKNPTSLFIFVQQGDCVQTFLGITNANKDFDIQASWEFSEDGGSIHSGEGEVLDLEYNSEAPSSDRNLKIVFQNELFQKIAEMKIPVKIGKNATNEILER